MLDRTCPLVRKWIVLESESNSNLFLRVYCVSLSTSGLESSKGHCAELKELAGYSANKAQD
jgi:hypothetical protein